MKQGNLVKTFAVVTLASVAVAAYARIGRMMAGSASRWSRLRVGSRSIIALWLLGVSSAALGTRYDWVIANGRVMDPETGLDAVRHIGIVDGRIAAIEVAPPGGEHVLDAKGLVVAPGFIDLHAHGQNAFGQDLKARDGVTTALELEVGVYPVAPWYEAMHGKARINYGASVGHIPARIRVKHGIDIGHMLTSPERKTVAHLSAWAREALSADELVEMKQLITQGLDEGGLGIGYGIQYTPGARRDEIFELFALAATEGVLNTVHTRHSGALEPETATDSVQEVIADALATGASLHLAHLTSTGLSETPFLLRLIDNAVRQGVDVTTEVYPYTALSTLIGAPTWDEGWQQRVNGSYSDLEWSLTGERLTERTFHQYRQAHPEQIVHGHLMDPTTVESLVVHPGVIIASDGMVYHEGKAHPRSAGTCARVLGLYVREKGVLSLMGALNKMTLLPAKRLESWVPAMQRKGRIQVGSDADITIFDPATVIDRATYSDPAIPSEGILHVFVNGELVVRDAEMVPDVYPGKPVRK